MTEPKAGARRWTLHRLSTPGTSGWNPPGVAWFLCRGSDCGPMIIHVEVVPAADLDAAERDAREWEHKTALAWEKNADLANELEEAKDRIADRENAIGFLQKAVESNRDDAASLRAVVEAAKEYLATRDPLALQRLHGTLAELDRWHHATAKHRATGSLERSGDTMEQHQW